MPDTASQVMAPNGTPVPPSEPTREYLSGRSFGFGYQTFNSLANHAQTVSAYLGDELYDEMLLDSTVRSSINTLKSTILSEQWELQSAVGPENFDEETDQEANADFKLAQTIKEFCDRVLAGLDEPLDDMLWQILDGIPYGCMLAEKTYKDGEGIDRGKLVLASIHVKPRWAWNFQIDNLGNVVGFSGSIERKREDDPRNNLIERSKCVLFSWLPKARDPRGTPALDAAYEPWNLKVLTRPQYWKYLSRFAVPSYWGTTAEGAGDVPERNSAGVLTGNKISAQAQMLATILAMENASGAVGAFGAKLEALDPQGDGSAFREAFDEFRREIVFAILQQARATMEAQHSSKADGANARDVLGVLGRIGKRALCGVVVHDILKDLVRINFGPEAVRLCPKFTIGMIDPEDFSRNANAIARLAMADMLVDEMKPGLLARIGLGGLIKSVKQFMAARQREVQAAKPRPQADPTAADPTSQKQAA